jgi:multidrug efflux pump subunit AcrA (membrane-fusion protein)
MRGERLRLWCGSAFRGIGVAVLLIVATATLIGATSSPEPGQAIVNGRPILLRSPVDGLVTTPPPMPGSRVKAGQALLSIENHRLDRARLTELETEAALVRERAREGREALAELTALARELEARVARFRELSLTRLQALEAGASAARDALETPIGQGQRDRARGGGPDGSAAQQIYLRALAALELARIRTERQALEEGVHLSADRNDVPYSQQRLDEIRLLAIELMSRVELDSAHLFTLESALAAERRRLDLLGRGDLIAPADALVWRRDRKLGPVSRGGRSGLGAHRVRHHARHLALVARCQAFAVTG